MHPVDAEEMTNSIDPNQTAPERAILSGSTLVVETCLCEYYGSLRYAMNLQLVVLDYGMKDKNPIDSVRFYMKDSPDEPIKVRKDQVTIILFQLFFLKKIIYHFIGSEPANGQVSRYGQIIFSFRYWVRLK